jgi:hypothetical protein
VNHDFKYLIYGLVDPRDDLVKYVGRSSDGLARPKSHFLKYYYDHPIRGKIKVYRWIKKLIEGLGLTPGCLVLERFENESSLNDAERKWIKHFRDLGIDLKNLTDGGEGSSGYKHTAEALVKIRANGKIHGERRRGVPNPVTPDGRKRIKNQKWCVAIRDQSGTEYPSISEAARILNINQSSIVGVLAGRRRSAGGKTFTRVDNVSAPRPPRKISEQGLSQIRLNQPNRIKIKDQFGKIYDSLSDAARQIGSRKSSSIGRVLSGDREHVHGYQFRYLDDPRPFTKFEVWVARQIEDNLGRIYEDQHEAAEATGTSQSAVSRVLMGKQRHCKGYRFRYVGDDKPFEKLENVKIINPYKGPVVDQNGVVYKTSGIAAKALGVSKSITSKAVKTGKPMRNGLTLRKVS